MKILFAHIPKNAGTAIATVFLKALGSEEVFNFENGPQSDDFQIHRNRIIDRYSFITGHVPVSLYGDALSRFDVIICVIRNPLDRFWSVFRFLGNAPGSAVLSADEFLERFYLSNPATRNEQIGYFAEENRYRSAVERVCGDRRVFVLRFEKLQEDLAMLLATIDLPGALGELRGRRWFRPWKVPNLERINVTKASASLWEWLNADRYAKCHHWFEEDFLFYEFARRNLVGGRPVGSSWP